jgi:hypothetical protein
VRITVDPLDKLFNHVGRKSVRRTSPAASVALSDKELRRTHITAAVG